MPADRRRPALTFDRLQHWRRQAELQRDLWPQLFLALADEIDEAWKAIENGYDIEPRSVFDAEAPRNGFHWPLVQALHHIWKRELKDRNSHG